MTALYWGFRGTPPQRVDGWFRRLQLVSAAGFSLMHGANDAQKTMGIITGVLVTRGLSLDVRRPVLGRARGARGDRPRHALGRLAHHPHHGQPHHEAPARLGLRRRNGRGCGDLHRHRARRRHQHHAHDHGRDRRRRRDAPRSRRCAGASPRRSSGPGCSRSRPPLRSAPRATRCSRRSADERERAVRSELAAGARASTSVRLSLYESLRARPCCDCSELDR